MQIAKGPSSLVLGFALLTCGLIPLLNSSALAHTTHSLAEAKSLAVKNDLPIVIDFYTEWCRSCQAFLKDVQENAQLQETLDQVVLLKLDAEKGEGAKLAKAYKVYGYPSFVMTTAGGEIIDRWSGYGSTAEWVSYCDAALADPTSLEQKVARYDSKPNLVDAKTLARVAELSGDYEEAITFYSSAKMYDADNAATYDLKVFYATAWGSKKRLFDLDQVAASADAVLQNEDLGGEDIVSVAVVMKKVATGFNQPERMIPYVKSALAATADATEPAVLEARQALLVEKALYIDHDKQMALKLMMEQLPADWQEDSNQLNNFAWWCFQNQVALEEAEVLARQAVGLAESDEERANILDTVAEICNSRGNCYEAVSLIQEAIELNPNSDYLRSQLEKFQTLLAEAG